MNLLLTSRRVGLAGAAALLACSNAHPGTGTASSTSGTGGAAAAGGGAIAGGAFPAGGEAPSTGGPSGGSGVSGGTSIGGAATGGGGSVTIELGPLLPQPSWPKTIPSVRAWHQWGGGAVFHYTPQTRIILGAAASKSIKETADVLAEDLQALLGTKPLITEGEPAAGDILLGPHLADATLGTEGYVLLIDDRVRIHGRSDSGTFWATRTLLQLLAQSPQLMLDGAAARDEPMYPERGFMIDNGRAYFSPSWLKAQIRQLSYVKLNLFHWHLADSQGFRIESNTHPEVVSAQYLTRAEVEELTTLAQRYHVEIVPEIDVPGHMDAVLAKHQELVAVQDTYPGQQIDYTKSEARQLVHELIEDQIDLFPGRYFHLGMDEFTPFYDAAWEYAQQKYGNDPDIGGMDVAIEFANELATIVKQHGKTARIWNDVLAPRGVVEQLDTSIVIESWIDRGTTAEAFADAGFSLLNCNWQCTYYKDEVVLLSDACRPPHFVDGTSVAGGALRGLKYHVWCDPAEEFCPDESTVSQGIYVPLRALAESTWGAPPASVDANAFREVSGAIGGAPGGTP